MALRASRDIFTYLPGEVALDLIAFLEMPHYGAFTISRRPDGVYDAKWERHSKRDSDQPPRTKVS